MWSSDAALRQLQSANRATGSPPQSWSLLGDVVACDVEDEALNGVVMGQQAGRDSCSGAMNVAIQEEQLEVAAG
jgi:hypothetical protein